MILTLQHTNRRYDHCWKSAQILLCQVKTKKDAFAEMRRFLKINAIPSNSTSLKVYEERIYAGRLIPTHIEVTMWYDGYLDSQDNRIIGVMFGLWDDQYHPPYERFDDVEVQYRSKEGFVYAKRYLDDLATRKENSE